VSALDAAAGAVLDVAIATYARHVPAAENQAALDAMAEALVETGASRRAAERAVRLAIVRRSLRS